MHAGGVAADGGQVLEQKLRGALVRDRIAGLELVRGAALDEILDDDALALPGLCSFPRPARHTLGHAPAVADFQMPPPPEVGAVPEP